MSDGLQRTEILPCTNGSAFNARSDGEDAKLLRVIAGNHNYARMRGKGYSSQNAAASFYFLSWPAELIPACVTAIAVLARKGSDANLDAAHG